MEFIASYINFFRFLSSRTVVTGKIFEADRGNTNGERVRVRDE